MSHIPSKYTKMYLVPQDVYRNIKRCSPEEDLAEISEANQALKKDDFFTNTLKNEKKPHEPIKKVNKNQTINQTTKLEEPYETVQSMNDSTIFHTPYQTSSPLQSIKKRKEEISAASPQIEKKPQFVCEKCNKKYKREYYFKRHTCAKRAKKNADEEDKSEEEKKPITLQLTPKNRESTPSTSRMKRMNVDDYEPFN